MVEAKFAGTVGVPGLGDVARTDRIVPVVLPGRMNKAEQYLAVGVDRLKTVGEQY